MNALSEVGIEVVAIVAHTPLGQDNLVTIHQWADV